MEKILNYINGELTAPKSGDYFDNYNPSNGQVYSLVPDSDDSDIDLAVKAAQDALPAWSSMSKEKRCDRVWNQSGRT